MEQRLKAVAEASARILAARSLDETLRLITEAAREIVGAHMAVTSLTEGGGWAQAIVSVSLSDKYAAWRDYEARPTGKGIYALVCRENRPMRLTQAELEAHPQWRGFGEAAAQHPPLRGWLAVPLAGRDGVNLGLVQLSDKHEGEFDADDESVLMQLAHLGALAVENRRLVETAQAAERRFASFATLANEVMWETDARHRYSLFLAKGSFRMPRKPEAFIGLTRWQAVGADPGDPFWAAHIADLEAHRPLVGFEFTVPLGGGTMQRLRVNAEPMYDAAGNFTGYRGSSQDVSELRAAEAAAQASAARFEDFARIGSDILWETDAEHRYTEVLASQDSRVKPLIPKILGKTRWGYLGADVNDPAWKAHIANLEAHRPFRNFEYTAKKHGSSQSHLRASGWPIFAPDGAFKGYRGTSQDITDLREAEAAAKASEERFRNFAEIASDWLWETGPEHRFTYFGGANGTLIERPYGMTRWEIAGADLADPNWRAHLEDLAAERPFRNFEYTRVDATGRLQHISVSGQPFRDAGGAFAGYRGVTADVTAQREAEAAARQANQRYRQVVETANEGVWMIDAEARTVFVNQRMADMMGYTAEEMLGRSIYDFRPPEDRDVRDRRWAARREGVAERREARFVRRDGTVFLAQISAAPVKDAAGNFAGALGMVTDITERKKAEAALQASEDRFRDFAETGSDWMWETDAEHRLSFFAGPDAVVAGWQLGLRRWEVPGADAGPAAWERHRAVLAARAPFRDFEYRAAGIDGRPRWISVSGRPVFGPDGSFQGYRGVSSNVTVLKETEIALKASERRFRDFAAVASDWMWESDAEHRFTYFTPSRDQSQPDSSNAAIGKTRWGFADADASDPTWQAHIADLDAHKPFRNFEYSYRRPDGTTGVYLVSGLPVFDEDGGFIGHRGTTTDITAQRAAEAAAQESDRKYRDIVEAANEGLCNFDREMRVEFINRRGAATLGYTPAEMLGRPLTDFVPPERADDVRNNWNERRAGKGGRFEARYRHKDGRDVWLLVSTVPRLDAGGAFMGATSLFLDITDRKNADAALAASERRFRDIADMASDWFWETDAEYRFKYYSPARARAAGKPPEEVLGMTRWEYVEADLADPKWQAHLADHAARRPYRNFEYEARNPDGSKRTVVVTGRPVFAADGTFEGYRGIATDITAQRAAEAAARESERKYRHIVETANEGIWTLDAERRTTYVNPRMAEMLGYTPAEMLGRHHWDFMAAADRGAAIESTKQRPGSGVEKVEVRYQRKDGSPVWFIVTSNIAEDPATGTPAVLGMVTDITDRKRAEAAAAQSEARFRDFAEIASDWMWETDAQHRLTFISGANLPLDNEPFGRTRWELSGGDPGAEPWRSHIAALEAHRPFRDFEFTVTGRSGRTHYLSTSGRPVFDEQGEFRGYRGTTSNNTAQREAEAAAAESERRFRQFVETANEGVWMVDAALVTTYVNPRLAQLLGYSAAEMAGRSFLDFKHPRDHEASLKAWAEAKHVGLNGVETRLRRRDGRSLWVLLSATPRFQADGVLAGSFITVVDITDRRAAEQEVARARREIETFLASTSDGVAAFDNEWRFTYLNQPGERLFDFRAADVIGKSGFATIPEAKGSVFLDAYKQAKQDGAPVSFSAYSNVFNAWHQVRAFPTPEGITVYFRDVTAERASHLALAESERKLRAALENNQSILASISDGFVALDNDWRFTFINPAAERMWNRKAAEMLGTTIFDSLQVDPANPFHSNYIESKRSGEPVAFTAHSEIFGKWLEVRGYPHAGGYTLFFDDVTEERRAHRELVKSRKKLEAAREMNARIFETSLDLICIIDRGGSFLQVNPGTCQQFGYTEEEMIGHNASEFIHADGIEATRNALRDARKSRRQQTFENRCRRRDGQLVPMNWSVAWSEREQKYFLIGRDMTERIEAQERLNRSQRLEAVGQLTGGIAHDFNNLLTVVMGNSDALATALKDNAKLHRRAELSLEAARRAAELTSQLLAFARRQTLAPNAVEANRLVKEMNELMRRTLGAQIEIDFRPEPKLWLCKVDSTQLETALLNLALNARDAMPGGGTLTIATANRSIGAGGDGSIGDLAAGDYVAVAVSDTGTGMPPEVQARAFEPFFTTKDIGKGSGLGLAMVYGFVKQSGGHVAIDSEAGRGTTVTLFLPRAEETAAAAAPAAAPEGVSLPGGSETILVVEDDPAVRELVTDQLRALGYRVLVAGNGPTARNILYGGDKIDLLFTDVMMPGGLTGKQLADEAEKQLPGLKILFTTGYAEVPALGTARRGTALLRKPYKTRDLARTVRAMLDAPV